MPNYKRIVERTPIERMEGIIRLFINQDGDLVAEYASGLVQTLDLNAVPTQTIINGEFAVQTQVNDWDGGDAFTQGTNDLDGGGA
jgi:hypothetical protein